MSSRAIARRIWSAGLGLVGELVAPARCGACDARGIGGGVLFCPPSRPAGRRIADTTKQASLDRRERLENVRAAFVARASVARTRVLIVDDVETTGATLAGCAVALRAAGARSITKVVLARRVWCA